MHTKRNDFNYFELNFFVRGDRHCFEVLFIGVELLSSNRRFYAEFQWSILVFEDLSVVLFTTEFGKQIMLIKICKKHRNLLRVPSSHK